MHIADAPAPAEERVGIATGSLQPLERLHQSLMQLESCGVRSTVIHSV
jgi:hypothetical protein